MPTWIWIQSTKMNEDWGSLQIWIQIQHNKQKLDLIHIFKKMLQSLRQIWIRTSTQTNADQKRMYKHNQRYLGWGGVEALSVTVLQPWIQKKKLLRYYHYYYHLTSLIVTIERRKIFLK